MNRDSHTAPFLFHLIQVLHLKTLLNTSGDADGESVRQELNNLNDQLDSNSTAISENAVTLLDGLTRDKYIVAKPAAEMEAETGLIEEGAE